MLHFKAVFNGFIDLDEVGFAACNSDHGRRLLALT